MSAGVTRSDVAHVSAVAWQVKSVRLEKSRRCIKQARKCAPKDENPDVEREYLERRNYASLSHTRNTHSKANMGDGKSYPPSEPVTDLS